MDCTFELKVRNAQAAHFDAVVIYNNEGDDLGMLATLHMSITSFYSVERTLYSNLIAIIFICSLTILKDMNMFKKRYLLISSRFYDLIHILCVRSYLRLQFSAGFFRLREKFVSKLSNHLVYIGKCHHFVN